MARRSALPDLLRPPLQHPARVLAAQLRDAAPKVMWHALHPSCREPLREAPPPEVERLVWASDDGWEGSIRHVPALPGAPGEAVLLLHTLGLGPDVFRVGGARSLVATLRGSGFACYLPAWRGDREASAVATGAGPVGFDQVAGLDLPAIVAQVRAHARVDRVLVVGHGLGALAALAWVAREGDGALAGLVALGAPVAFPALSPMVRAGLRAVARVRPDLELPVRGVARVAALLEEPGGLDRRTAMFVAMEDVPVGMLDQIVTWCAEGALVDSTGTREIGLALARAQAPLLVGAAPNDPWCPVERARPLLDLWPGATWLGLPEGCGHLDLLVHAGACEGVHAPVTAWLQRHRGRAYRVEPQLTGLRAV